MTFKSERAFEGQRTILRISGRLRAEQLDELRAQIATTGTGTVLDLEHVTVVDVEVVRFLGVCEREGVELRKCPLFLREWMTLERAHGQ